MEFLEGKENLFLVDGHKIDAFIIDWFRKNTEVQLLQQNLLFQETGLAVDNIDLIFRHLLMQPANDR